MTDIRKAAEERYPHWLPPEPVTPDPDYSEMDASWQNGMADDQRNAFIAGAEWMRERAAQEIETAPFKEHYLQRHERLSAARLVRKIGASDG